MRPQNISLHLLCEIRNYVLFQLYLDRSFVTCSQNILNHRIHFHSSEFAYKQKMNFFL